jgi:hypothetical protein
MKGGEANGITDEVARFQTDLRRLALQIVDTVLQRELDARQHELAERAQQQARASRHKPAPQPKAERASKVKAPRKPKRPAVRQLALDLSTAPAPVAPVTPPATAATAATAATTADPRLAGGKRRKWTRDAIIEELARWLVNSNAVDASFVTRHGPPGLAAAARRVFGRFDAALNVASLHVARLYPDGPPPKNVSARASAAQQSSAQSPSA